MASVRPRIALLTFVYEGDSEIAFDGFEALVRSCPDAFFDVYLTDDASPSHVGDAAVRWWTDTGMTARCFRNEVATGYRGAIGRTMRLVDELARSGACYDLVLRLDTDALVVKAGLIDALLSACNDPCTLYGVGRQMAPSSASALLVDMLPIGLQRRRRNGRMEDSYASVRRRPVWWSRIARRAVRNGFRFRYADGCCYVLGRDVAATLVASGFVGAHVDYDRLGLLTSEEDVLMAMMCAAAGVRFGDLCAADPTWAQMNFIGRDALTLPLDLVPYVVHPLKDNPDDRDLRNSLRRNLPLFAGLSNGDHRASPRD